MEPFQLVFAGAENPGWRKMLQEMQAKAVGVSYYSLLPRLPKNKPWSLAEHFTGQDVYLDSGVASLVKREDTSPADVEVHTEKYYDFVERERDALKLVTEVDALCMPKGWHENERESFWLSVVGRDKFSPVWHAQEGMKVLEDLCEAYKHVTLADLPEQTNKVTALAQKHDVQVHLAGVRDFPALRRLKVASASTITWISPMKHGETIVWHGNRLARFPMSMKERARRRHRQTFIQAGFDAEKIAQDDQRELARYTVHAFLQMEDYMTRRGRSEAQEEPQTEDGVTHTDPDEMGWDGVEEPEPVAHTSTEARNLPVRREAVLLPTLALVEGAVDITTPDARPVSLARSQRRSMRQCDNCIVSASCPAYSAGQDCAYDIPLEIQTPEQMRSFAKAVMEIQGQRVLFLKMAEDLDGGAATADLSSEMDRLFRLFKVYKEITEDSLTLKVEAKATGGALSALFGARSNTMQALGTAATDQALHDIVDGEVL